MFVLVGVICFTAELVGSENLASLQRDLVFFRVRDEHESMTPGYLGKSKCQISSAETGSRPVGHGTQPFPFAMYLQSLS